MTQQYHRDSNHLKVLGQGIGGIGLLTIVSIACCWALIRWWGGVSESDEAIDAPVWLREQDARTAATHTVDWPIGAAMDQVAAEYGEKEATP